MKRLLCRVFGHKLDDIQRAMFEIELKALNTQQLKPSIVCRRCGVILVAKKR